MLAVVGRAPAPVETLRIHEDRARGSSRAAILRSLLRTAAAEGKPPAPDWTLVLPRRVDVSPLLAERLPPEDFIDRAYRTILGRPPAPHEIGQQRRALRWPRTRSDFIAALAASPEAERSGDIVLIGLGRRGPSLRRFIAGFRGATPGGAARREVEEAVSSLREMLQAQGQELANVTRQLAPLHSVAVQAQSTAAAIERIRLRSEIEGAKTAEIAADTRSLHDGLRDVAGRLVDVSRVVALLGERSQSAHESLASLPAIAATSYEVLEATRMLAEVPAHRREFAAVTAAIQAAVSDLNVTVQNIDRRVIPPVIPAGETVVTQVDGFSLGVPAREWRLSTYYHTRGPLEPGVYALFQKLIQPGMTVADVGANVGLYTLLAARLLQGQGRVFSFEPTPAIFHLLRENVRLNGFSERGVVLYDLAVSDREGEAVLYTDRLDSTHNSLFPESSQTEEIRVRTARLDDILGPDITLDFVKIDAEGSEPLVLHGMGRLIRNNPPMNIIMEFAPGHLDRAGRSPGDVIDEIMSAGFAIQVIDPLTGDLAPARREALVSRENTDVFLARDAS
jgi:FkbM family methyltransferase